MKHRLRKKRKRKIARLKILLRKRNWLKRKKLLNLQKIHLKAKKRMRKIKMAKMKRKMKVKKRKKMRREMRMKKSKMVNRMTLTIRLSHLWLIPKKLSALSLTKIYTTSIGNSPLPISQKMLIALWKIMTINHLPVMLTSCGTISMGRSEIH